MAPKFIDRTAEYEGRGFVIGGVGPPQPEPQSPKTWAEFIPTFAFLLSRLEKDRYCIVEVRGTSRYLQFMGGGPDGMRAECVSNLCLPGDQALSDEDCRRLLELGWNAPTHESGEPPGRLARECPNYFRNFDAPVPFDAVSALATRTLTEIHRARTPDDLGLKVGASTAD